MNRAESENVGDELFAGNDIEIAACWRRAERGGGDDILDQARSLTLFPGIQLLREMTQRLDTLFC